MSGLLTMIDWSSSTKPFSAALANTVHAMIISNSAESARVCVSV